MKSDLSLGDLKKQKKKKSFIKKELSKRIRFFIVNCPMGPERKSKNLYNFEFYAGRAF